MSDSVWTKNDEPLHLTSSREKKSEKLDTIQRFKPNNFANCPDVFKYLELSLQLLKSALHQSTGIECSNF